MQKPARSKGEMLKQRQQSGHSDFFIVLYYRCGPPSVFALTLCGLLHRADNLSPLLRAGLCIEPKLFIQIFASAVAENGHYHGIFF